MNLRMGHERPGPVDEILDAEGGAVGGERHERRHHDQCTRPANSAPPRQTEEQRAGDPDRAELLHVAKRDEEVVRRSEAMRRDPDSERVVDRARQGASLCDAIGRS
jgi:hypothetical protein